MSLAEILDRARRLGLASTLGLTPQQMDWAVQRAIEYQTDAEALHNLCKIPAEAFVNRNECKLTHTDHMPGIYEGPGIGPCCAHCQADLGVPGEYSEPEAMENVQ